MIATTNPLTAARAAALFVSDVSATEQPTGVLVEAAIKHALQTHGAPAAAPPTSRPRTATTPSSPHAGCAGREASSRTCTNAGWRTARDAAHGPATAGIPPGRRHSSPTRRSRPATLDTAGRPVRGLHAKSLELLVYLAVHNRRHPQRRMARRSRAACEPATIDVPEHPSHRHPQRSASGPIRPTAETAEHTPEPILNTGGLPWHARSPPTPPSTAMRCLSSSGQGTG
jgi:hypothetical protein